MSHLDRWNRDYFGGALSDAQLTLLSGLESEGADVQRFVERMFLRMSRVGLRAQDMSELVAWETGVIIPRILPSAWGGMVPPITLKGRHRRIDEYLKEHPDIDTSPGTLLLDIGCGFPPLTTVDLADAFPDSSVVGADPSFARFMVTDERGDYAAFGDDGRVRYFQPGAPSAERWDELHSDPDRTRKRFQGLLGRLRPLLPPGHEGHATAEADGVRLVSEPVLGYEREALRFVRAGLGEVALERAPSVVRCMNVLIYFDEAFQRTARSWIEGLLDEGGTFLWGMDWARTTHARYLTARKRKGALRDEEFAFSIDNVRPLEMIPFFSFFDDDRETGLLERCMTELRSDASFIQDYDRRMDRFLEERNFCPRKPDGYLGSLDPNQGPEAMELTVEAAGVELDRAGLTDRAIEVLRTRGFEAWRNPVGHVAIRPESVPD